MSTKKLTQEYLKECFSYCANTGNLIWLLRPRNHFRSDSTFKSWNSNYTGRIAGYLDQRRNYVQIRLDDTLYQAHRLVYLYHEGWLPPILDHINNNGSDNRLSNLRPATNQQNLMNHTTQRNNKLGYKGVSVDGNTGNIIAVIHPNRKKRFIGVFESKEQAAAAYNIAARAYFGEFAWQNDVDYDENLVPRTSKFFRVYYPVTEGGG